MRTQNHRFRLTAAVTAAGLVMAQSMPLPASAQGLPPPPPFGAQDQQLAGDPPARVGRLARVSGTVSFHTQDDSQWAPATLNYPVTSGDAFWTEPNAEADIEVSASRVTMAPGTELDVATLNDTVFQATEPQGEIYLRVRAAAPDETYAVQTPRGLVTLASPGRYGVAAGDIQTPTTVTVIEGSARVAGPGLSLQVGPNQTASITGTDALQGEVGPAQPDPFLMAMLNRDQPPQPQQAPPPVVAAMPGGDDLTQYGAWAESPDYGQVWYPQVAPDWIPYQDGRWDYVGPWGWTWVDSEPWGFAPFHYGRWARIGGRWGWCPGEAREHVYAPALVAFFGVGAAVGIGVGAALAAGRVGWVPLGPHEGYRPWYRTSDRYVQRVNIGHVTNVTTINRNVTINNFANRGAATVVPEGAMTASRPVRSAVQRVDPAQLAQARPVFGQQPLRPTVATTGVTPAVARQLSLTAAPGPAFQHPIAPGPTIRPAGLAPGAVSGARPPLEPPHNPVQPPVPASAGVRPFSVQPPLAAPRGAASPAIVPRPGTPAFGGPGVQPALRAPVAPGQAGPPAVQPLPGSAGPATALHPFPTPGAIGPPGSPPPSGQPGGHVVGHAAIVRPVPQPTNPPPQVFHPAAPPQPQALHAAPPPVPQVIHPPPQPQVVHAGPPPIPQVIHPPPQPQMVHAAPPPPVVHPPPPAQPVHIAAPPPQVHAPPPPPAPHPAPAPQQQRQKRPGEP